MRYISLIVGLCCFTSITSRTTSQNIAGNKSAPCNLPFPRIATNEFSHPDTASCRKAAQLFFNNTHIDPLTGESFSKTKLNDSLYMWSGALDTEVRFVVRSSNEIPQVINYWEIEKSIGDDSQKLKNKIDKVIKKLRDPAGCNCKVIREVEETPDMELPKGKTKAWRAVVECSKKANSPALGALRDEKEVSGIVINPTYP